jgi:hypothetical protein
LSTGGPGGAFCSVIGVTPMIGAAMLKMNPRKNG